MHKKCFSSVLVLVVGLAWPGSLVHGQGPPDLSDILISEIAANVLTETTDEAIELYNSSDQAVDLAGWQLQDPHRTQTLVDFDSTDTQTLVLEPGHVAVILDADYAGAHDDELAEATTAVLLLTTQSGSLSLANSSDSFALLDGNDVKHDEFTWTSDPGEGARFARTIEQDQPSPLEKTNEHSFGRVIVTVISPTPQVIINEVFPRPESASDEFIELSNTGNSVAKSGALTLSDLSGKTYVIKEAISPGELLVVHKADSGLALNDSGDGITLRTPGDLEVLDEVSYESAQQNESWSRFADGFAWTLEPTPNAENILREPFTGEESKEIDPESQDSEEELDKESATDLESIADALSAEEGAVVSFTATVTTRVDNFFDGYVHVGDPTGGVLVKLLDNDDLNGNDVVKVTGEVNQCRSQPCLRLTEEPEVLGQETIKPSKISLSEFSNQHVGQLVVITGTVSRRSSKSFRIAEQDSEVLVSVRKNSKITKKPPAKASQVTVTGIALKSGESIVVAPRSSEDISLASANLPKTGSATLPILFTAALAAGATTRLKQRTMSGWDRSKNS